MTQTMLVNMAIAGLLAAGLWRGWHRLRRIEAISAVLCAAFLAALGMAQVRHGADLRPLLAALDAFVVLAMLGLWARHHSQRARVVGTIGAFKCVWALSFQSNPALGWYAYAVFLNGCFVLQALVAGGFADGIAIWLADRWRGNTARRARLIRDVG